LLSGGQRRRLSLAKVIIENPDLLILDEPTNHLDLDMIEWLETFLSQSNSTIIMVTHDRYFLEVVCNTIYELVMNEMTGIMELREVGKSIINKLWTRPYYDIDTYNGSRIWLSEDENEELKKQEEKEE